MKKFKSFIYAVILISIPFLGDAGSKCEVSSNADNNKGHCRARPGGGDWCYSTGSGPACSGTLVPVGDE